MGLIAGLIKGHQWSPGLISSGGGYVIGLDPRIGSPKNPYM